MTRGQRKSDLVALVADLLTLGYSLANIGRLVNRTPERIGQIRADLGLTPPHADTVDDLPVDIRTRVAVFIASESEPIEPQ